jgi:hypothetical protein
MMEGLSWNQLRKRGILSDGIRVRLRIASGIESVSVAGAGSELEPVQGVRDRVGGKVSRRAGELFYTEMITARDK